MLASRALVRGVRCAPRGVSPIYLRPRTAVRSIESKSAGLVARLEVPNTHAARKFVHWTNVALMGLVPAAFFVSPSPLSLPVDLALGVLIPVHAHVGMNEVITDYVPKNVRTLARVGWLGVTVVMFLGMLRTNIQGPGLTETIKTLWREPPRKEDEEE